MIIAKYIVQENQRDFSESRKPEARTSSGIRSGLFPQQVEASVEFSTIKEVSTVKKLLLALMTALVLLMLINVPMNGAKECSEKLSFGINQDTNELTPKNLAQRSQNVETASDEIITAWGDIKSLF